MNIYRAREILPVKENYHLFGRTLITEAIIKWDLENPTGVRLGEREQPFNYARECLPILTSVRIDLQYRGTHYDGDYFRFGWHVFKLEEIEAIDTWISYYAGPSLFM